MRRAVPLLLALAGCGDAARGDAADAGVTGPDDASTTGDAATSTPDASTLPPPLDASAGDSSPPADGGAFDPPDAPGPYAVDTHLAEVASSDGVLTADYFLPKGRASAPIVFLRHGYTRAPQNLRGWGERLASHGFAAAIPSTRDSGTSSTGQADLEAVVTFTLARASAAGSFLSGAIDASRVVLGGHSSGGLAATLAAAGGRVPVAGLVLLDTEAAPEGEAAAAKISVPTVGAFAEPDMSGALSCNEQGGGVTTANDVKGPLFAFRVKGASHCDLESNSDALCAAACGATSDTRFSAFETYVTAWLEWTLRCDARARPWVDGSVFAGDPRVTTLAQARFSTICP